MRRVVITGFGAYTPIGNTEKEIKESFYQGKSGTVFIPEWKEIKGLQSFVAGTVKNFDEKILDRKLRRSMGKLSMMTTSAAKLQSKTADYPKTFFIPEEWDVLQLLQSEVQKLMKISSMNC